MACSDVAGRVLVSAAVVSVLFGGCSSNDQDTADEGDVDLDAVPAAQRDAVADGEVTFEEYRGAVVDMVDCVRSQGFTIEGPLQDPRRPQFLAWETMAMPGAEDVATDQATAECEREYLSHVSIMWAEANFDPDSPLSDDTLYVMTIDCVEATTGDDLSRVDPSRPGDLDQLITGYGRVYDDCIEQAADELLAAEAR